MKHIQRVREFFQKTPVASLSSINLITKNKKYSYTLINHLTRKGEIKRITRGYYTIHDDPLLSVFCFRPSYIGLQDAMSIHNIWEQETCPVIITTKKVRNGSRTFLGCNAVIRRISKKYFFGIDYRKNGDFFFPVSDIEKTFIDMVYFNQIRRDTARKFTGRLNAAKLKEYLRKYDKRFSGRVMSFLDKKSCRKTRAK
ncbi:MAG: hypothetical protein NT120_02465 [Candidatus Aenigmarchaeota archaeon]|nr:hypothetical protein [Candidatus Aenigmarchaeota archaeon]